MIPTITTHQTSYKDLKKQLKRIRECSEDNPEECTRRRAAFFTSLESHAKLSGAAWRTQSRKVLFAARRLPRGVCTSRYLGGVSVQERSVTLAAWAELSREAVRKILKKYRKITAQNPEEEFPRLSAFDASFSRGCLRTEIEALAKPAASAWSCPICLEVLIKPVAPSSCGHAVCGPCFDGLVSANRRLAPRRSVACPVCRETTGHATALPLLAKVAKAAQPDQYRARKEARLAQDAAAKYAWRLQYHPMAALREWEPGSEES